MAKEVALGSVKDHDRTDVFGISGREVQRIIGTQREANHCKAAVGSFNTFVEKPRRLRDLGFCLEVVGVKSTAQGLGIGNGVCDFAMIEVRGECYETGFRKP